MAMPDKLFHDEVIVHIVRGIPYKQHVILCNPGDWPEIKAEIGDTEGWLEFRCRACMLVVGTLAAVPAGTPGDDLGPGNPLGAAADDAGTA
jgi:hypothetical protein